MNTNTNTNTNNNNTNTTTNNFPPKGKARKSKDGVEPILFDWRKEDIDLVVHKFMGRTVEADGTTHELWVVSYLETGGRAMLKQSGPEEHQYGAMDWEIWDRVKDQMEGDLYSLTSALWASGEQTPCEYLVTL